MDPIASDSAAPDRDVLRRAPTPERANEWALVLLSAGFAAQVRGEGGAFVLRLPEVEHAAAEAVLRAYEQENPTPRRTPPAPTPSSTLGFGVGLAWLAFFFVTGPYAESSPWFEAGRTSARAILSGEVWRTVTALTLHADVMHVTGNALLGALLINAVGGMLGPGVAALAVLASGIVGNGVNAWMQPPHHTSVGGSTAVFGALGLLGSLAWQVRRHAGFAGRRLWLPLAAGLGLIAMVGVGGPRTDVWAHLFGFASGAAIGALARARRRPGPPAQVAALGLVVGVLAVAWHQALGG